MGDSKKAASDNETQEKHDNFIRSLSQSINSYTLKHASSKTERREEEKFASLSIFTGLSPLKMMEISYRIRKCFLITYFDSDDLL